jgi:hypothetical protein
MFKVTFPRKTNLPSISAPPDIHSIDQIYQRQQANPSYLPNYWNGLMVGGAGNTCSCGFSAVRHRFLCASGGGLFLDDVREAMGGISLHAVVPLMVRGERMLSKKRGLNELMDCLRFLSLNRNLATCFKQAYYLGDLPATDNIDRPNNFSQNQLNSNYVVSRVDVEEFDVALRSVIQAARGDQPPKAAAGDGRKKPNLFHPWGIQVDFHLFFT